MYAACVGPILLRRLAINDQCLFVGANERVSHTMETLLAQVTINIHTHTHTHTHSLILYVCNVMRDISGKE